MEKRIKIILQNIHLLPRRKRAELTPLKKTTLPCGGFLVLSQAVTTLQSTDQTYGTTRRLTLVKNRTFALGRPALCAFLRRISLSFIFDPILESDPTSALGPAVIPLLGIYIHF